MTRILAPDYTRQRRAGASGIALSRSPERGFSNQAYRCHLELLLRRAVSPRRDRAMSTAPNCSRRFANANAAEAIRRSLGRRARWRARRPDAMAMKAAGGRELPAAGEDRDRDLPPQDDPVFLLHDGAGRDGGPQGRSLPPRLPLRAVLSDRLRPRTRCRARLSPLADPGQGLLREQGRARLQPTRLLRPPRLRLARRLADGIEGRDRPDLPARPDRLARRARLRRVRGVRAGCQLRLEGPEQLKGSVYETDFASSRQLVAWCSAGASTPRCSIPPSSRPRPRSAGACATATPRTTRTAKPVGPPAVA